MKNRERIKTEKRERRHKRIRSKVSGTAEIPRFSIFKSNRFLYVQLIDDLKGKTLVSASTKSFAGKNELENAQSLGEAVAKKADKKKIKTVVFDRSGYLYTGKVKAVADAARKAGLKF